MDLRNSPSVIKFISWDPTTSRVGSDPRGSPSPTPGSAQTTQNPDGRLSAASRRRFVLRFVVLTRYSVSSSNTKRRALMRRAPTPIARPALSAALRAPRPPRTAVGPGAARQHEVTAARRLGPSAVSGQKRAQPAARSEARL